MELALDLHELEDLIKQRRKIKNLIDKSIIKFKLSQRRKQIWIHSTFYEAMPEMCPTPIQSPYRVQSLLGYIKVDALHHYATLLYILNAKIRELQLVYFEQRLKRDQMETYRMNEVKRVMKSVSSGLIKQLISNINGSTLMPDGSPIKRSTELEKLLNLFDTDAASFKADHENSELYDRPPSSSIHHEISFLHNDKMEGLDPNSPLDVESGERLVGAFHTPLTAQRAIVLSEMKRTRKEFGLTEGMKLVGNATISAVEGFASESLKSAEVATQGALRSIFEVTRALEMLTVGAYYKTSTTAFVTFKSRVSACSSYQMLLSHDHSAIDVKSAPNPKDLIWENVSVPQKQIIARKFISSVMITLGVLFWSIVVYFVTLISTLDTFSEKFPVIKRYSSTDVYRFLNNYMSIGLLLVLLNSLPLIFDFISRHYERIKLESEIQNSVMDRYFNYQVANIFVAVQIGSLAARLSEIIASPSSIATILGTSLPSVSIYFMNMLVIKTFTAVPLEMMRLYPLFKLLEVKLFYDEKKFTENELHSGVFADPPILYGWVYPNLLMVLMIMVTYSCVS